MNVVAALRRTGGALALVAVAVGGPRLSGPPGPPSLAPSAAQMLPPGARVREVPLAGGGFARAIEIELLPDSLRVLSLDGWREIPGVRAAGAVTTRRLWLGSDHQGRSLLARTVHGARISVLVAAIATLLGVGLGAAAGLAAALSGAVARGLLQIGTDGLLGLPRILLLLLLGLAIGGSPAGIGLAIGLSSWMEVARLVEAEAASVAAKPFVAGARGSGAGAARLVFRHVLPSLAPLLAVAAPLVATEAVLLESTLSFLGVSTGDASSWGRIVAEGRRLLPSGWWIVVFPGLLLCVAAFSAHALARPSEARSVPVIPT